MKASDMNKIGALYNLRQVYEMLGNTQGLSPSQRNAVIKLRAQLNKALLSPHWDDCNKLITEDDS